MKGEQSFWAGKICIFRTLKIPPFWTLKSGTFSVLLKGENMLYTDVENTYVFVINYMAKFQLHIHSQ
jgi:hypothetical protein